MLGATMPAARGAAKPECLAPTFALRTRVCRGKGLQNISRMPAPGRRSPGMNTEHARR